MALATFQVLNGHMWLVAAVGGSAALDIKPRGWDGGLEGPKPELGLPKWSQVWIECDLLTQHTSAEPNINIYTYLQPENSNTEPNINIYIWRLLYS